MRAYVASPFCSPADPRASTGRPGWRAPGGVWAVTLPWLLMLALSWGAPVSAQDEQARARALFAEGVAAFDRGSYGEALAAFEGAYRLAPHPAVRVNMANCFEQLGRFVEARFNYQRFLEESAAIAPEQRAEIEAAIEALNGKIGKLFVVLDPSDAELSVDGQPVERAPDGSIELASGMHTFRATKPGYLSSERMIQVEAGSGRRIMLQLAREGLAPPVAEPLSAAEPVPPPFAPVAEKDTRKRPQRAVWIALGSAVVFGAGAGVSGALAWKAQRDFDAAVASSNNLSLPPGERQAARSDGLDAANRADVLATVTDVLLAGAAVSAGTAFVLWLVDRRASPDVRSVSFVPSVGSRGQAQAVLRGAF